VRILKEIYYDHYRTTPVSDKVFKRMLPFFSEKFYLPVSFSSPGTEIAEEIENAKQSILKNLNAENGDIIFTGSGTIANNTVIHGILRDFQIGENAVSTIIDHPSIINTLEYYKKKGLNLTLLKVDEEGMIDLDKLKNTVDEKTAFAAFTMVNHTIGTIQDIEKISAVIREKNPRTKILVDISVALNSQEIDLKKLNADFLSFSGHKIYGPKGTGAVVSKGNFTLKPFIFGSVQTSPYAPGGENLPGIVGIASALDIAVKRRKEYYEKTLMIKNELISQIEQKIPDSVLNGHRVHSAPDNINFSFRFVEGESIMMFLDFEKIVVATGSACASSDLKVNYILSAIGRDHEMSHGSIRITTGWDNDVGEVEYFTKTLKEVVERLRAQSTLRRK